MKTQDTLWKEKTRVQWFLYCDKNIAYFHRLTKIKVVSHKITRLKERDYYLKDQQDIEHHLLAYYHNLFTFKNERQVTNMIRNSYPSLVINADNFMSTRLPSMEEVNEVVFAMDNDFSLCPDGFDGCSFKHLCDMVGLGLFNPMHQFCFNGWIMPKYNSNIVAFILKTPGADMIECFRPIIWLTSNLR